MRPTLLELGMFEFHAYTVCMALGFLIGTILSVRQNYQLPRPYDVTPAGGLLVFIFALIGAKVYWFIQYGNLWEIYQALYIWQGGLVFYGGLFGGIFGAVVYLKWVKVPVFPMADIVIPFLPLSHSIARLGCFLNGCCWGVVTDAPWGVRFPRGTSPYFEHLEAGLLEKGSTHSLPVHPTQLYESLGLFIIFLIMRFAYKRHRVTGIMFILYFFLYGILRFIVEGFRGDSEHPLPGLTASQVVALCFVTFASLAFVVLRSTIWQGKSIFQWRKCAVPGAKRPEPEPVEIAPAETPAES